MVVGALNCDVDAGAEALAQPLDAFAAQRVAPQGQRLDVAEVWGSGQGRRGGGAEGVVGEVELVQRGQSGPAGQRLPAAVADPTGAQVELAEVGPARLGCQQLRTQVEQVAPQD